MGSFLQNELMNQTAEQPSVSVFLTFQEGVITCVVAVAFVFVQTFSLISIPLTQNPQSLLRGLGTPLTWTLCQWEDIKACVESV